MMSEALPWYGPRSGTARVWASTPITLFTGHRSAGKRQILDALLKSPSPAQGRLAALLSDQVRIRVRGEPDKSLQVRSMELFTYAQDLGSAPPSICAESNEFGSIHGLMKLSNGNWVAQRGDDLAGGLAYSASQGAGALVVLCDEELGACGDIELIQRANCRGLHGCCHIDTVVAVRSRESVTMSKPDFLLRTLALTACRCDHWCTRCSPPLECSQIELPRCAGS